MQPEHVSQGHGLDGAGPPGDPLGAGRLSGPRFVRDAEPDLFDAGIEGFEEHLGDVAGAILDGDVVPILGAGVNLCDRTAGEPWEYGRSLPNGAELADMLARKFAADMTDARSRARDAGGRPAPRHRPAVQGAAPDLRGRLRADLGAPLPGRDSRAARASRPRSVPAAHRDHELRRAARARVHRGGRAVRRPVLPRRGRKPRAPAREVHARRFGRDPAHRRHAQQLRRGLARAAHRDPQDPRAARAGPGRGLVGHHRGSLHRLPHPDDAQRAHPGEAAREARWTAASCSWATA